MEADHRRRACSAEATCQTEAFTAEAKNLKDQTSELLSQIPEFQDTVLKSFLDGTLNNPCDNHGITRVSLLVGGEEQQILTVSTGRRELNRLGYYAHYACDFHVEIASNRSDVDPERNRESISIESMEERRFLEEDGGYGQPTVEFGFMVISFQSEELPDLVSAGGFGGNLDQAELALRRARGFIERLSQFAKP